MKAITSRALGLVPALALCFVAATSASAATKGINLPWMNNGSTNYGSDIGWNYNSGTWGSWIDRCKWINSYHIRIWLHEGWDGLSGSAGNLSVTSTFQNNLANLSSLCGSKGVSVEWVLLNGAGDGSLVSAVCSSSGNRSNFANNVASVDRSKTWGSGVDYFDVINEYNYGTSNANAKALVDACGVLGSRTASYDGNGSYISGYLSEFHTYGDWAYLPAVTHCGEFGPTTKNTATWQQVMNYVWSQAKSRGVNNVMPWKANDTGDGLSLYNSSWNVKTEGTYWANLK